MGLLLGEKVEQLNVPELVLLILAAYYHDQGMIVEPRELEQILDSEDWRTHDSEWGRDHPNRGELLSRLSDPLLTPAQRAQLASSVKELETASFTSFIRTQHGQRSGEYIRRHFRGDPRLTIDGRNVADLLAKVCESHVLPPQHLTDAATYRYREFVGTYKVNVSFLCVLLRLADILDFDRDRTPDSLYRAIDFTSAVSLQEWEKHRSIVGWDISPSHIAFAAECEHPAYERAVKQFLQWVEEELRAAAEWSRQLPTEVAEYALDLPIAVDTAAVGPSSDPTTGHPRYIYMDLEFSLARDELVKLLMTSELYQSRGLFVRELLQNSLDALRHRAALFQLAHIAPPHLEVRLFHSQDAAGFDVVTCTDNGVGMDLDIIVSFLTRAGRSYYRSPQFDKERARFRDAGCDFDPCARFGIGFMSCFMFGDDIVIATRRDYGMGRSYGRPWVIEITGLSGIIVVREGDPKQPVGTTVEVRSRRKTVVVDRWSDPVWLVPVIEGYALATEYPIQATCTVPGISESVNIPVTWAAREHPLERAPIEGKKTFRVELQSVDPDLNGEIRVCVLSNSSGEADVATPEARIEVVPDGTRQMRVSVELADGGSIPFDHWHESVQVCADGILIAGEPGRQERERYLGSWGTPLYLGGACALIDSRGTAKPSLTPARTPPRNADRDGTWRALERRVGKAYGQLLEQIVHAANAAADPVRIWQILAAYDLRLDTLPLATLRRHIRFPVKVQDRVRWLLAEELGEGVLTFKGPGPRHQREGSLRFARDGCFTVTQEMSFFYRGDEESYVLRRMEDIFLALCTLRVLSESVLSATLREDAPRQSLGDCRVGERHSNVLLTHLQPADQIIAAYSGSTCWNVDHPVIEKVVGGYGRDEADLSPIDEFLRTLAWSWPTHSAEGDRDKWWSRQRWRLGRLHAAIDWAAAPPGLQPPYSAFVAGQGVQTISASDLQEWNAGAPTLGPPVQRDR